MLAAWLGLISLIALGNAALGFVDLMNVSRLPSGTVFQQISARVDVLLSLLVHVTAAGLAGLLMAAADRNTIASKEAMAAAEWRNRNAKAPE